MYLQELLNDFYQQGYPLYGISRKKISNLVAREFFSRLKLLSFV